MLLAVQVLVAPPAVATLSVGGGVVGLGWTTRGAVDAGEAGAETLLRLCRCRSAHEGREEDGGRCCSGNRCLLEGSHDDS